MKTLDQIGIGHQTDKATQFTRTYGKPHGYLPHMEQFFAPWRHEPIKLLEIGVAGGESIRTWLDFFDHPETKICGVDIAHDTNPWNTPGSSPDPRYTFCQGDQGEEVFWKCFAASYGSGWQVIVDDGSHFNKDVITTFQGMWPHLAGGGVHCIEDLAASYGTIFLVEGFPTHVQFINALADEMNQGRGDVDSIYLARELAIVRKEALLLTKTTLMQKGE